MFKDCSSRKNFRGYFLDELRNFMTNAPFCIISMDSPTINRSYDIDLGNFPYSVYSNS